MQMNILLSQGNFKKLTGICDVKNRNTQENNKIPTHCT